VRSECPVGGAGVRFCGKGPKVLVTPGRGWGLVDNGDAIGDEEPFCWYPYD
jgi:hypothetical protein